MLFLGPLALFAFLSLSLALLSSGPLLLEFLMFLSLWLWVLGSGHWSLGSGKLEWAERRELVSWVPGGGGWVRVMVKVRLNLQVRVLRFRVPFQCSE